MLITHSLSGGDSNGVKTIAVLHHEIGKRLGSAQFCYLLRTIAFNRTDVNLLDRFSCHMPRCGHETATLVSDSLRAWDYSPLFTIRTVAVGARFESFVVLS